VFRPDLYDAALGARLGSMDGEPADRIGAFAGAPFDPRDVARCLASWAETRRTGADGSAQDAAR
jgi:two-component system, oxyanion-binding sensor